MDFGLVAVSLFDFANTCSYVYEKPTENQTLFLGTEG